MIDRENCTTLADSLISAAKRLPNSIAFEYVYINNEREYLTYSKLFEQSLCVATALLKVVKPGDRVLLPCFREREFHVGFYACLLAGCIAVPCHSPRIKRKLPEYGLGRFKHIVRNSQSLVMLAPEQLVGRVSEFFQEIDDLNDIILMSTERAISSDPLDETCINISSDTIAYLQYTSGSTSDPKGVVITHESIINNQVYMAKKAILDESVTSVNWLPLYHDMGLTLGCMTGIWLNGHSIIMSPFVFISKPELWLQEISGRPNVMTGGPNFAYVHCLSKIGNDLLGDLDLSNWRVAINGAEPIIAETLQNFSDRFSRCGFSYRSFFPSYGMAEATLFISGARADMMPIVRYFDKLSLKQHRAVNVEENNINAVGLVGCGNDFLRTNIAIVDTNTRKALGNGEIGEIWISSESAGKGYWMEPVKSREVFEQQLEEFSGRRFYRSGDLGFLDNGELFVSGRIKDMIIVNGANYYPQDIEQLAKKVHQEFAGSMAAAFTVVSQGKELTTLVIESSIKLVNERGKQLIGEIKTLVSAEFQIKLNEVHFAKLGCVPRTTSGKVQRSLCKNLFQKNALSLYKEQCNIEPIEELDVAL